MLLMTDPYIWVGWVVCRHAAATDARPDFPVRAGFAMNYAHVKPDTPGVRLAHGDAASRYFCNALRIADDVVS